MIDTAYFGNEPIEQIYFDGTTLLPVTPKTKANFVTGEYSENGEPSTFSELFNFARAGKAWLVKDTGLQEYAIDVPRFEDGLLIEESATNLSCWSFLPPEGEYAKGGVVLDSQNHWRYDGVATGTAYLYPRPYPPEVADGNVIFSAQGNIDANLRFRTGNASYSPILKKVNSTLYQTKDSADGTSMSGLVYPKDSNFYVFYYQVESMNPQKLPTSPIKTTTAPSTRPADFIKTKKPIAKVKGDWDSTLNISVVDGQLAHTGYGRIRTMEIEYV